MSFVARDNPSAPCKALFLSFLGNIRVGGIPSQGDTVGRYLKATQSCLLSISARRPIRAWKSLRSFFRDLLQKKITRKRTPNIFRVALFFKGF